jgi:hypothetical protein
MNRKITLLLAVTGMIVLVVGFFWLTREPDIAFARRVFSGLINGDQAVKEMIDWASFQAMGVDVGNNYAGLPDARQKELYSRAFIANFSVAFSSYGVKFSSFTNWRVSKRGKMSATVAVNGSTNKALLFTVSNKYGKRKLVSLQSETER